MNKTVTIKHIAELAGVNPSTVSRAFNPDCGHSISAKMRKKILAIAEKHEYSPINSARSLAHGNSFHLGLMLDKIEIAMSYPNFTMIFGAFCREALLHGYQAVLLPAEEGNLDRQVVNNIRAGNASGYMVETSLMGSKTFKELGKKQVPVVSYISDRVLTKELPNVCVFMVDDAPAFDDLFSTVRARGFDSFALFGTEGVKKNLRHEFYKTSKNYGLTMTEKTEYSGCGSSLTCWGEAAVAAGKNMGKIKAHKLIICYNDLIAMGLCDAITKAGLKVGKDISVIGYDNIEEHPNFNFTKEPFLATIAKDDQKTGREMVKTLIKMIKKEKVPQKIMLPAHFIPRDGSLGYA